MGKSRACRLRAASALGRPTVDRAELHERFEDPEGVFHPVQLPVGGHDLVGGQGAIVADQQVHPIQASLGPVHGAVQLEAEAAALQLPGSEPAGLGPAQDPRGAFGDPPGLR